MEVHKHPHHVMHKKKWTEYLLEFFMLFLAVFLGFMAENIRENITDRQKEKEYMISLVEDLKTDTTTFNRNIHGNNFLINGEDSVLNFLSSDLHKQDSAELAMIYFFKYGINYFLATVTDRTISQLKNNGGMRLIKNKAVADQITSYYNSQKGLDDEGNNVKVSELANNNEANHIFNIIANRALFDSFMVSPSFGVSTPVYQAKTLLTHQSPDLLMYDQKAIATFMADIDLQRGIMLSYILKLLNQKTHAEKLIKLIQAEYHLENE